MKVGDKVLCKKDFYIFSVESDLSSLTFTKGKWYEINKIEFISDYKEHYGSLYVENDEHYPCTWIDIKGDGDDHRCFSMIKQGNKNYFKEHFLTVNEIRKLKLMNCK